MRDLLASSLPALLIAGCWTSATPAAPVARVVTPAPHSRSLARPFQVEFGTYEGGVLHPTLEIPLFAGSVFGWRIRLPCRGAVELEEQLTLPAPGDWPEDPDMTITNHRRTATVDGTSPCEDGWIEKQWSVSPNDPEGAWTLRVLIDGYEPQTFRATFTLPAMTGGASGQGPTPAIP